ncbi:MAG: UDP-N-acetylmuramoyl-tripeptide--D-alanyl-D-alanine ligase [Sedimentisphaerales bacterium]|nr:UDP-N-acetylmuramoyl-tripeptide--D-alanyl-D-alanine ligase [Sedimentisphaerales bacterium]
MKPLLLEEIKNAVRAELKTELSKGLAQRVCTDSRQVQPGDLFVALRGEKFDGHDFLEPAVAGGARALLVDRSMPLTAALRDSKVSILKVDDCRAALGRLGRFYRRELLRSVRIVAVTGTNGKTTVREMIYWAMSKYKKGHRSPANYNNDIGVPLTLLGIDPDHEFAVVEIGSNRTGEVAALARVTEPDVALITYVGPGHLEGLRDVEGVSVEKVSITAGLKPHGILICGCDHAPTLDRVKALGCHVITFGLDAAADVSALELDLRPGRIGFLTNDRCRVEIPLSGLHNVKNALAALAATRRLGITSEQFAAAMRDFPGIAGRMECQSINGITIIDDSYNANPSSMAAALLELTGYQQAGRRILVAGDMCELGPTAEYYHRELGRAVALSNVDVLFAVGPQAAWTAQAALECGMGRGDIQRSINSRRLARLIKSSIRDDDVILVKGSRSMQMERVVQALRRYRGGRPRIIRAGPARELPAPSRQALVENLRR